jgi:hypothetical protein
MQTRNAGFASTPSGGDLPFGHQARLDTFAGSNNAVRVSNAGSREARKVIATDFEGRLTVSFVLSATERFEGLIVVPINSSGTDTVTETYSRESSGSFQINITDARTDVQDQLEGCVIATCQLSVAVGDLVQMSFNGAYADEAELATPTLTA